MKYWKNITIDLLDIDLKFAMDKLSELDIISVTISDKRNSESSDWFHYDTKPLEFDQKAHKISLLVDEDHDTLKLIKSIKETLGLNRIPAFFENKFKDQEWTSYTQSQFNEINISKSLRIIPPWISKQGFEGKTIVIQPGSGFGIGTHPTTQLCLKWLDENDLDGGSFLDYGSGSGILAITAKKLGALLTEGLEIDLKAIDNAKKNTSLNGVDINFYKLEKDLKSDKYDNVIANILSSTLISISPNLKKLTRKRLVLSGILKDQAEEVIEVYSEWIDLGISDEMDEWIILSGKL